MSNSGLIYENEIATWLDLLNIHYLRQVPIGKLLNTHQEHKVDFVINDYLVEVKYLQHRSSIEGKLMEEILMLAMALDKYSKYPRAYILLGGHGWSTYRKEFYTTGRYKKYFSFRKDVSVLDEFTFKNQLRNTGTLL